MTLSSSSIGRIYAYDTIGDKKIVSNTMDPNSPQHIYQQIHKKESDPTLRILNVVALQFSDLKGKTIIDVGSGKRQLAKRVKKENVDARVISYDIDKEALGLSEGEDDEDVVIANFFKESFSSFQEESVDMILNVGGPFRGGPFSTKAVEVYVDALRVLKPGGEIRIYNPYMGEMGGIAALLYYYFHETIDISNVDFKAFFGKDYENVIFDERGVPTVIPPGGDFWTDYFNRMPKEVQEEYCQFITEELREQLTSNDQKIDISLIEREGRSVEEYDACLIIQKL